MEQLVEPGAVYISRRPYPTLSSGRFQILRVISKIGTAWNVQVIGEYDEEEEFHGVPKEVCTEKKIWKLPMKEWRRVDEGEVNMILMSLFEVYNGDPPWNF